MNAKKHLSAAVISIGLALSGCGTMTVYEGAVRPNTEIARLKARDALVSFSGHTFSVWTIDGRHVAASMVAEYELLPGMHKIGFVLSEFTPALYFPPLFTGGSTYEAFPAYIEFNAEPGKVYVPHGIRDADDRIWSWIVEEPSEKIVAGSEPP